MGRGKRLAEVSLKIDKREERRRRGAFESSINNSLFELWNMIGQRLLNFCGTTLVYMCEHYFDKTLTLYLAL